MGSLPVGILIMIATVFYAVDMKSWPIFLNLHSIVVVIVGTIGVFALSTPTKVLGNIRRAVKDLMRKPQSVDEFWPEFNELAKTKNLDTPSKNKLINTAINLWESGVSTDLFIVMLSQKRNHLESADADAVQALRNLAKYPPALGMIGTVVGLVSLFSDLGASNKSSLGPALALAMTATFFGLILANAVITPLADRLHVQHMTHKLLYTEVYQVLLLINRGESLDLIYDEVEIKKRSA